MWEWAAPKEVHGSLVRAMGEMNEAVDADTFFSQVLLTSLEACRGTMDEQSCSAQMVKAALGMPSLVENVLHEANSCCQMHACRSVRRG